jgi:hypothetical protein
MTVRDGRDAWIGIAFFSMIDNVRVTMVRLAPDMFHRKLNADMSEPSGGEELSR